MKLFDELFQDFYSPAVDFESCLKRAEQIIDPKLGIVKSLFEIPQFPGEPPYFLYTAILSDIDRVIDCPAFSSEAGGASIWQKEAKMRALGEAMERYCAFIRPEDKLIHASYEEVGQKALDPLTLPLCSDKEYANPKNYLVKPRRDAKLSWIQGFSLSKRRELLVPANLVYLSQRYSLGEEPLHLPISTGLACGANALEAILSGLCEVVERDAFTITWYHQLSVPRIDLTQVLDEAISVRLEALEKAELEPFFFNITTEVRIPSILLVLLSKTLSVPVLTVTTATHPDPNRALTKAIDEGVLTRKYCVSRLRGGDVPKVNVANPSEITELEHHLFAYIYPETLSQFDFLLKNPATISLHELPDLSNVNLAVTLRDILAILDQWNMEVIVVNITTEDIKEAGFVVMRVLVPAMEPLSQDHNIRFLGRSRLYEVPKRVGYEMIGDEAHITNLPHPFA